MPEIAVILPTLDERENLSPMVERLTAALDGIDWEAIIVDDDSSDGTADEARRLARANPRVRVLQRIGRRGLASAVIEGACATAAPVVAVMDADHQHDGHHKYDGNDVADQLADHLGDVVADHVGDVDDDVDSAVCSADRRTRV